MEMITITVKFLAATVQALQAQFAETNQKLQRHHNELEMAAQ